MTTWLRELRQATRILHTAPGFAVVVVTTLALGIGATTAIFSVFEAVVLHPLPFPESNRLMALCESHESVAGFCVASPPNVEDWARGVDSFERIGLAREWSHVVQGPDGAERLRGALATPEYLEVFRVQPARGRLLVPEDLQPGAEPVVVLSHALWQRRFGGAEDPEGQDSEGDVLGKILTLDGVDHTIVGVLPAGLRIPETSGAELWTPLPRELLENEYREWRGFSAVGRLGPEVSQARAQEQLSALAQALGQEHPETNRGWDVRVTPLRELVVGSARGPLLVFLTAGGLLLLIGCANGSGLLLARWIDRERELAVRAALGAGRSRLVRLLLSETLFLATVGGGLGILLALFLVRLFRVVAPADLPRLEQVALHPPALVFALTVTLLTVLLVGVAPSLRFAGKSWIRGFQGGVREVSSRSANRFRQSLAVVEMALALVLLVGAGLLVRSFLAASQWTGGIQPRGLYSVFVLCPEDGYRTQSQVIAFYREAVRELEALPGVLSAGAASAGPLMGGRETFDFRFQGSDEQGSDEGRAARWFDVHHAYFDTVGIPVVRGRGLTDQDTPESRPVALINQTLARRFWPDADPLGKWLQPTPDGIRREVVGVVADVPPLWPQTETEPEVYWPFVQQARWGTMLIVRAEPTLDDMPAAIRSRLHEVAPGVSLGRIVPFEESLAERLVRPRFHMMLLGTFAVLALVLAVGGIFSVLAYSVSRRTREIGLRMALGARRQEILRWVIGQGLMLTGAGVAVGLAGAFILTRFLQSLLYETPPTDPWTVLGSLTVLLATTVVALWLPALRASQVDPVVAIQAE